MVPFEKIKQHAGSYRRRQPVTLSIAGECEFLMAEARQLLERTRVHIIIAQVPAAGIP